MVRNNITRWSPNTCGCVIEYVTVYDDGNEKILEDPRFLLMNDVCDDHKHLASPMHRENHAQLSNGVLAHIEEAKSVNLGQVHMALDKAVRASHKRDLMQCRNQVIQHNERITEEWNELVSFPHAFDSHIYDIVLDENRTYNNSFTHLMDHLTAEKNMNILRQQEDGNWILKSNREYSWKWSGKAPNRVLNVSLKSTDNTPLSFSEEDKAVIQAKHDEVIGKGKVILS